MNINELAVGKNALIERYRSNTVFSERLMELGLTPGTRITLVRRAPFSGPIEIAYGHLRLALRPAEGDGIYILPV
ncbi:hypothetical protein MASR2M18_05110 [Ignavibacteria bacterium]|jgi:Fe2+ transport system protein FeoA|nr:ferrous iron transport protein A [Bacteroidota bacterium]MCZ2132029.1 ferrous iron transport protein A [Bacteroidota bacterium]